MSRKLMNLALMYTAITAYASEHPFGSPSPRLDTQKDSIPSDKKFNHRKKYPRCGKVNAPWVMQCSCNRNTQILPKVGAPYYEGDQATCNTKEDKQ